MIDHGRPTATRTTAVLGDRTTEFVFGDVVVVLPVASGSAAPVRASVAAIDFFASLGLLDVDLDGVLALARGEAVAAEDVRSALATGTAVCFELPAGDSASLDSVVARLTPSGLDPSDLPTEAVLHIEHAAMGNAGMVDPLTGLLGRSSLLAELGQALRGRSRRGLPVAVVFVDLDHFKRINDTQGHHVGDDLLRQFAARLRVAVPHTLITRFGGDEFVLAFGGATDERIERVTRQVLDALADPFTVAGRELVVSASLGVASCDEPGTDPAVLLQEADTALFEAKRLGRARAHLFNTDLRRRLVDRVELERDLRAALGTDQLSLHYQPQVEIVTGDVVGLEALLRWRHPSGRDVPPLDFVSIAEESGLIEPLGAWVVEQACGDFVSVLEWAPSALRMVSVNLSPRQLADPTLVENVAGALRRSGLDPTRLCLEVTESGLDPAVTDVDALRALRNLGCYLGIDDFGTGYSSLGRLRDMPFEVLKIDGGFVAGLGTDSDDSAIVAAIMSLALTMGLHVIAEGVETSTQADALADLGCAVAQGYLYSRPVPLADLAACIDQRFWRASPETGGSGPIVATQRRGRRRFIHEFLEQIGVPMDPSV